MEYKKILIAVDSSSFSIKAAKAGFSLAHSLKATVGILYVVDKKKEIVNADLGITPGESQTVLLEEAESTIKQYTRMYNDIEDVVRFTPEGSPENEILNIAADWEADMIVMGTHGRTGLERMLTGSIAEYVLRHAKIPVLITPPEMK